MKLAFSTLGCPAWGFPDIVSYAGRHYFSGIEMRGIKDCMTSRDLVPFNSDNFAASKQLLVANGVQIVSLDTSVSFDNPDLWPQKKQEAIDGFAVCHRMGIPAIRVFGDRFTAETQAVVLQQTLHGMAELFHLSGSTGIWLEVHGNFNTIETLLPIVQAFKDEKKFGLIWDVAHSDITYQNDWQIFYSFIKPYIRHVHLKDHIRAKGRDGLCLPGKGDIPLDAILRRLIADGYNGFYSFEWEKRWHPNLPDPEIAFPCFINWMETYAQVENGD